MNESLKNFFSQYQNIIKTGLENHQTEKEIYNAVYSQEFDNYLKKGRHPRLDELDHVVKFVREFRNGGLNMKNESNLANNKNQNKVANGVKKIGKKIKQYDPKEEYEMAQKIRDRIHNLDIYNNKDHMKVYNDTRHEFFEVREGRKCQSYWDSEDLKSAKRTVGIGFNMDANGEGEWNRAFKDENTRPNYQDVYSGKTPLTDKEIDQLFNYTIGVRQKALENKFGDYWKKLKPNERLAIEDYLYHEGNVNKIKDDVINYIKEGDKKHLTKVIHTIKFGIKPQTQDPEKAGKDKRKNIRAILINSPECPLYSKPNEEPIPERYKNKNFVWIWNNKNHSNPNMHHRDVLNGNEYRVGGEEWKWMTSKRIKGCNCTYKIAD